MEHSYELTTRQIESIVDATASWRKDLDFSSELAILSKVKQTEADQSSKLFAVSSTASADAQKAKDSTEDKSKLNNWSDAIKEIAKDNPSLAAGLLVIEALVTVISVASPIVGSVWPLLVVAILVVYLIIIVSSANSLLRGKVLTAANAWYLAMQDKHGKQCLACKSPGPKVKIRWGGWLVWLMDCPSEPVKREFLVAFDTKVVPFG